MVGDFPGNLGDHDSLGIPHLVTCVCRNALGFHVKFPSMLTDFNQN
jgi:hypothetical protein